MYFQLIIELGNDAMQDGTDVANVLRVLSNKLETCGFENDIVGTVRDENGNTVGRWEVSES